MNGIERPRKVCLCKSVSKEQILKAIEGGCVSVADIARETMATTGCGTCKKDVQRILDQTLVKP